MTSCAAPQYLSPNAIIQKSYLTNKGTFSVQNLDQKGQIEPQSLSVHYDGFDVKYKITPDLVVYVEITNNTNKSLIIDKSKCYVLYNGYSTDLFKDVRSSRSTTFNNVQDAINSVQTGDASITMTIPPYSRWQLPLGESNVRSLTNLPDLITDEGTHSLQPYDNPEPVEFVIPYTFDYALAKWETSRNRFYVGQIETYYSNDIVVSMSPKVATVHYLIGELATNVTNNSNKAEIDYINNENIRRYKSHNNKVKASHIIWGIVLLPTIWGPISCWLTIGCDHKPVIYNSDGTTCGTYNKYSNYRSTY